MFPIRDHNPSERTPYVTYGLIAANILIFISYWPLFSDPVALAGFFDDWGLVPVEAGREPSGFLTSMFLHGGIMHLGGNMLFLWIFGDNMEDEMGHGPFLGFYLAGGIGAALFQVLSSPGSTVPMVGASGAIAAVLGGYLLMYPKARVDILLIIVFIIKILPVPAWLVLGAWFALQIFGGIGSDPDLGGVAYWAHAGGFLTGVALTLPLWFRRGGPGYWQRNDGHPPHPEATYRWQRSSIPRVPRR